jgi:flagellar biosynthesis protein FlhB
MADDFQEKTEEATPKKLSDSRKKGQVSKSQDLTTGGMLFFSLLVLLSISQFLYERITNLTLGAIYNINEPFGDFASIVFWVREGVYYVVMTLLPFVMATFVTGLTLNVLQVGFLISPESLVPKWTRVNLFDPSNWKKFADLQAIMKLAFGISKLFVVAIIITLTIYFLLPDMSLLMNGNVEQIGRFLIENAFWMALAIAIILISLGIMDFIYQKWKFANDMKMSRQELKDERKQSEGDASVKSRMRSMMQSFTQSRMKQSVPEADVIIANPTHYAIALKYDVEKMVAPVCLAKGMRKVALSIKDIAAEHKIPIVENPPLARGLYKSVEIGGVVPPEFFHAVAEVLAYVYSLDQEVKQMERGRTLPSSSSINSGTRT